MQERLGPLNSIPEMGGFHTPLVAGYGHAEFQSPHQQNLGHTFVPTTAGTLPGPPVNSPNEVHLHQLKEAVKGGREYLQMLQSHIDSLSHQSPALLGPKRSMLHPGGLHSLVLNPPQGPGPQAQQAAPIEMHPSVWGGPQVGFQQAAFAPPPAYAHPPQGLVPWTNFDHMRLQAPGGHRQSTYVPCPLCSRPACKAPAYCRFFDCQLCKCP